MSTPDDTRSHQRSKELGHNTSGVGKLEMRKEEGYPLKVSLRMTSPKCGASSTDGLKVRERTPEGSKALGILNGVAFVSLGSWLIYSLVKAEP